jgi:hypothetical protein
VYEVLRHYRIILRLSPFSFDDFCAALLCEELSVTKISKKFILPQFGTTDIN